MPTSRLSGDGPDAGFNNLLPVISGRSIADRRPGFAAQTAGIALTVLSIWLGWWVGWGVWGVAGRGLGLDLRYGSVNC
jgi:hypothetical protein